MVNAPTQLTNRVHRTSTTRTGLEKDLAVYLEDIVYQANTNIDIGPSTFGPVPVFITFTAEKIEIDLRTFPI